MNLSELLAVPQNWALFGLILITLELFVPGMICLFLGLSAFLVSGLLEFGWVQGATSALTSWFIGTIIVVLVFQKFFKKFFPSNETYDEYEEDQVAIGTVVSVIEDISPQHDKGRIFFRGTTWNARSKLEISAGSDVVLVEREGLVWNVSPVNHLKSESEV